MIPAQAKKWVMPIVIVLFLVLVFQSLAGTIGPDDETAGVWVYDSNNSAQYVCHMNLHLELSKTQYGVSETPVISESRLICQTQTHTEPQAQNWVIYITGYDFVYRVNGGLSNQATIKSTNVENNRLNVPLSLPKTGAALPTGLSAGDTVEVTQVLRFYAVADGASLAETMLYGAHFTYEVIADAQINEPPTATISVSPSTGYVPLSVSFSVNAQDSDGAIASYHWDFGDGSSSNYGSATHTYNDIGSFTATCTVTDDDGATCERSQTVSVNAQTSNLPPNESSFYAGPISGTAPHDITYNAYFTDPEGTVVSYLWDFGDGETTTGSSGSHTYSTIGTYTASVTATDSDGYSASQSQTITVSTQHTNPDTDNDGLPDSWENNYFGGLSQTASGDYDGDGYSNLEEYNDGTDPTDATDPAPDPDTDPAAEFDWNLYAIASAAIGLVFALVVFGLLPAPLNIKGLLAMIIAAAGFVAAFMFGTGAL